MNKYKGALPSLLRLGAALNRQGSDKGGKVPADLGPATPKSTSQGSRTPDPAAVAWLLGLPLDRFAQEGCPLEIRVRWLDVSLWLVPSEADAEALVREGVSRGRVWTAGELLDLLAVPGLTREQARTVARVKAEFDGEVVEVRPPVCRTEAKGPERRREGDAR